MNIEDELKHKACNIDFFAKRALEEIEALNEFSGYLMNQTNSIQGEIGLLRKKIEKLKEALNRIGTGELITTQRGTIFMDRDETITLQDYVSDVLKVWG